MKKSIVFILFLMSINCCFTSKTILNVPDRIQIDYVDLYVTTPLDIKVTNFYTYFGKSVKTIIIKDKVTLMKCSEELNRFVNNAEKVNVSPDIRLLITFYIGNKKQTILMGSTLLNVDNKNYIANDKVRVFFGELTGNSW